MGQSFAQDFVVTQETVDLLPYRGIFQRRINPVSDERKRDALLELRNFRSVEASRIAAEALKDSSEIVRATAAASVVFLPKDKAAQNLAALLADKKPLVRREAAFALGVVGNENSLNALLRVLQRDKVLEVRNAAAIALGQIGNVAAIPELVKLLERNPQAKEEFMRRSAARSIGQIAQILQTGKIKVLTPESFLPESYKSIEPVQHPELIAAFPQFRPAVNVLIRTLQNPKEFQDVKREAAFALGAIGDESAVRILQSNANSADYYLAEIARESLRKIAAAASRRDGE